MYEWVGWAVAALLIALYVGVVVYLYRSGRLGPDRTFSLYGPLLMMKTQRGRSLLDRWGRFRRSWSALGDLGLALAALAMVAIVVTLLFEAALALRIPAQLAPQPAQALGLPGINPFIPLGYGLVAIVVGIVIHEMFHGIVARSQNIGVKSLGILWLVLPVGAFVEQDDQEMQQASRRHRGRVAAAGVLANFLVATVTFFLLALMVSTSVQPNATGVGVAYVVTGSPAANISLQPGDIITLVNGNQTPTNAAFFASLEHSRPGQTISLSYWSTGQHRPVTAYPTLTANPNNASRGFLGVATSFLPPAQLLGELQSPWSSSQGVLVGVTTWIVLPVGGLEPVSGSALGFFHVTGPLAAWGVGNFWILANLIYWLAWMNLLLGLSNALPLVPLDGGLLFRDWVAGLAHRFRKSWDAKQLDRFAGRLTIASSLFIVFLILWQFVAPRLHGL